MHVRIFRLNVRNPLIGALLLLVALAFVIAAVVFGLTLLVGAVALGGVALLARRILRFGRREPAKPQPLDAAQEVFPPPGPRQRLPSDTPPEN